MTKKKLLSPKTPARKVGNAERCISLLCDRNSRLLTEKAALGRRVLELEQALRDIFAATDEIKDNERAIKSYQMSIVDAQSKRARACGRGRALLNS